MEHGPKQKSKNYKTRLGEYLYEFRTSHQNTQLRKWPGNPHRLEENINKTYSAEMTSIQDILKIPTVEQ